MESQLFQQLFAEEQSGESDNRRRRAIPLLARVSESLRRRSVELVAASLLTGALLGGALFVNSNRIQPKEAHPALAGPLADGRSTPGWAERDPALENEREATSGAIQVRVSPTTDLGRTDNHDEEVDPGARSVPVPVPDRVATTLVTLRSDFAPNGSINERGYCAIPPSRTRAVDPPDHADVATLDESDGGRDRTGRMSPDHADHFRTASTLQRAADGTSWLSASYRHGFSAVADYDYGKDIVAAQEMSVSIEGRIAQDHILSLSVGQRGVLRNSRTYRRATSSNGKEKSGPSTSSSLSREESELAPELWAGIGYDYAVARIGNVEIEAGAQVGVGEKSMRYGVELPASVAVTDNISAEVVPFMARITPYNQSIHTAELSDPSTFGEERTPAVTTFGAHLGITVRINR
jgi:hypothetical protein